MIGTLAVAAMLLFAIACQASSGGIDATVTVDFSTTIGQSAFTPGYTFDECTFRADADQCGRSSVDRAAMASAKQLLAGMHHVANVQMYGWGTSNPEPKPGVYDLGSLSERLNIIRSTNGTPMVTFCCSPDWMAGGSSGASYTDMMYEFPKPENYDAYARLAARIATENPDVKLFQVWNEFKGLYAVAGDYGQWDAPSYTTLYNKIYDAVKAVRPDAQIGGAYPVIVAWTIDQSLDHPSNITVAGLRLDQRPLEAMMYWLRHKHGAEFLAVDGGNGARNMENHTGYSYTADGYAMCDFFKVTAQWLRSLDNRTYPGAQSLPLRWAEWYANPALGSKASSTMSQCLIPTILSGATSALIWGGEGRGSTDQSFPLGLWTGTVAGGGKPTAFYKAASGVQAHFGPGTNLYQTTITGPIGALASRHTTMLVNHTGRTLTVQLNTSRFSLPPYDTVFAPNSGS